MPEVNTISQVQHVECRWGNLQVVLLFRNQHLLLLITLVSIFWDAYLLLFYLFLLFQLLCFSLLIVWLVQSVFLQLRFAQCLLCSLRKTLIKNFVVEHQGLFFGCKEDKRDIEDQHQAEYTSDAQWNRSTSQSHILKHVWLHIFRAKHQKGYHTDRNIHERFNENWLNGSLTKSEIRAVL